MKRGRRYKIEDGCVAQPILHSRPEEGSFLQRVKTLVPEGVEKDPIVLFLLGNESVLTDRILEASFRGYGARADMVILCAEHRGYGKSISGRDQSFPDYVRVDEALADYHGIFLKYRECYRGPWVVGGHSYGGGLSIAYAHAYPDDCAVVLSSSGVVDWDATIPSYDSAARENLGGGLYERLCDHVDNLSPAEPFDSNWRSREILYAFVTGLSQNRKMCEKFLGVFDGLARLPTRRFLSALRLLDSAVAGGEARNYAASNSKRSVTSAEAESGRYRWRVWRYQQAMETGTFWAPAPGRSIYRRTVEDWRGECLLLFGTESPVLGGTRWDVRSLVPGLRLPLVYVRGGRDPWRGVGLEPDYPLKNGRMLSYEDAFHCPDRDTEAGLETIETVLSFLR